MTKTYKSNTCLSISVVMPSGKSRRVSFNPLTSGASTFTTSDPGLQKALESHYNFGRLFRVAGVSNVADVKETKTAKAEEPTVEAGGKDGDGTPNKAETAETSVETKTAETNLTVVKVADLGEARDYLANKFNVSRTTLRGTQKVLDYAKRHGIEFDGLKTE